MFTIVTYACYCAPEDAWVNEGPSFNSFEDAKAYANAGRWNGDVLVVKYNGCEVAFMDDYRDLQLGWCPAIARLDSPRPVDVELPF